MSDSKPLIFVIDDDKNLNEVLEGYGEAFGYEVECHVDPKTFLPALKKRSPVLCLIDLNMDVPGVGLTIIQAIRNVMGPNIPLVLMSGTADSKEIQKATELGANGFLPKPFNKSEFEAAVKKYTEESTAKGAKKQDPALAAYQTPNVVLNFYEHIAPILADLSVFIEDFDESEAKVQFYVNILREYEEIFVKMVNSMRSGDELPLEQCVRLYGVVSTKRLVLAIKLKEMMSESGFEWDKDAAKPKENPDEIIPFAIRAVEHFGDESRYETVAFICGLVFDILNEIGLKHSKSAKAVSELIEDSFGHSLEVADSAFRIGKEQSQLTLDKHIVTTSLLRETGKITMAIFEKDYLPLLNKIVDAGIPTALRHIVERKNYGVSMNLISGLICLTTPGMKSSYRAILFNDYPYMLSDEANPELFDLASACHRAARQLRTEVEGESKKE